MLHQEISITNQLATVHIDLWGGAITGFQLNNRQVNPLSFRFSQDDMPENNKAGAPYQGHFLCLGRWGRPTAGELSAGVPDHGQFANMLWENGGGTDTPGQIHMHAKSTMEGLEVNRTITLDRNGPLYLVNERVSNPGVLGRTYQMVQHPTLAAPFLDNETIVNTNAAMGFNNVFSEAPDRYALAWPNGFCADMSVLSLSKFQRSYNSVFSFVVKPGNQYGWITVYSPKDNLLLGYLWPRAHYPWIIVWQHWEADNIVYLGLEFGTTGLHKSINQILDEGNPYVFGEKTYAFIDAGETVNRGYYSFLCEANLPANGIEDVRIMGRNIVVRFEGGQETIALNSLDGVLY